MRRVLFLAVGAAALPGLACAEDNSILIHTSHVDASGGYAERDATGAFLDWNAGRFGMHADVVTINGDVGGSYGAFGVSYHVTDTIEPSITIGGSGAEDGLLPVLLIRASARVTQGEGWITTPSITYRDYGDPNSTGAEHSYWQASLDTVRYFTVPIDTNGYWAAQAGTDVSFNSSNETPWSLSLGLQTVRNTGFRFGVRGEVGFMAWDPETNAREVQSRTWSVGANVGYAFAQGPEVFIRTRHTHNDFYDSDGLTAGLRLSF